MPHRATRADRTRVAWPADMILVGAPIETSARAEPSPLGAALSCADTLVTAMEQVLYFPGGVAPLTAPPRSEEQIL
jgi:hypothetical protein